MKQIDKKQALARHFNVPVGVMREMFEEELINEKTLNRTLTNILLPEYIEKHGTKRKAFMELSDALGVTEHTIQGFHYNNRNNAKLECDMCGCTITNYRYYQRNKKCAKCDIK